MLQANFQDTSGHLDNVMVTRHGVKHLIETVACESKLTGLVLRSNLRPMNQGTLRRQLSPRLTPVLQLLTDKQVGYTSIFATYQLVPL